MVDESERMIAFYQRHGAAWAQARGTRLVEANWLDRLEALLAPPVDVLDLGCGSGRPIGRHLHDLGHAVTGVDSSPAMLGLFRQNLPGRPAILADMRDLDLGRRFDAVIAWDSFFHLAALDQPRTLAAITRHAEPGAAFLMTTGPARGVAWGSFMGEALHHASLEPSEYRLLLEENGWEVLAHVVQDPDCGGHTVWLARRAT